MEIALACLTAAAVEEGKFDKAVLPVGATEYHGDHLPYGADSIAAETLARRFAADVGGMLMLPALAYGVSSHHLAFPWTLSLQPATLTAIVTDIAESLLRHNIRKLLVVSAHDGNPAPIEAACRRLHEQHGLVVAVFSGWQRLACALLPSVNDLDHGGRSEMSMVLHGAPDLVRPDLAADLPGEPPTAPVQLFGSYADVAPRGYSGAPSQGTAEEGRAIVDAIAARVVPFLRRLDAHGWQSGPWLREITTTATAPAAAEARPSAMIRRAVPEDGPLVRDFVFATLRSYGIEPDPEGLDADVMQFGTHGEGPIDEFVAEFDGRAVGSIALSPRENGTAHLSKFFLDESYRGKGWGRLLLSHAVSEAERRGYARLELETRTAFQEAVHLYEATGWQRGPDLPPGTGPDRTYWLSLREPPRQSASHADE